MPIRIALVNDYEVVVHGLATMLREYDGVVEVVELDANTAVARAVDVALYDTFAAPRPDRDDLCALVGNPNVGCVAVYTWNFDPGLADAALAHGARGYLSKGLTARELVAALQHLQEGDMVVSPRPRGRSVTGGDWPGREEGLTERESEVLALITRGLNNAGIAEWMALSPNSVKSYIRSCYRRIGVSDRANAILWGIEHGFRSDRVRIAGPSRRTPGERMAPDVP